MTTMATGLATPSTGPWSRVQRAGAEVLGNGTCHPIVMTRGSRSARAVGLDEARSTIPGRLQRSVRVS